MKNIYLIRHCKATGQEPEAPLTQEGAEDAASIANYFKVKDIDVIYSSPYLRAIETIKPYSLMVNKEIIIDERLKERVLSTENLNDWMQKLEATYKDLDLKFEGGESSNEAMLRALTIIQEVQDRPETNFILVTHGALLSLIIKCFDESYGFEEWKKLKNPDVYLLTVDQGESIVQHLWDGQFRN